MVYFGKRYYDPEVGRWMTPDPAWFVDGSNRYAYVRNNPLRYLDPNGQFITIALPLLIWGAELALPSLSAMAMPVLYGALTGAALYSGYKLGQVLNKNDGHKLFHKR